MCDLFDNFDMCGNLFLSTCHNILFYITLFMGQIISINITYYTSHRERDLTVDAEVEKSQI